MSVCDKHPTITDMGVSNSLLRIQALQKNPNTKPTLESPQEWDEESSTASYLDSLQKKENPTMLRCLMLVPKNQKEKFQQNQRRRALREHEVSNSNFDCQSEIC